MKSIAPQALTKNCKYYEAWENGYNDYFKISDKYRPEGYLLRLPLYIQGARDAHIILSQTANPDLDNDSIYEIAIGSELRFFKEIA